MLLEEDEMRDPMSADELPANASLPWMKYLRVCHEFNARPVQGEPVSEVNVFHRGVRKGFVESIYRFK
jgi:hypothetical protein